MGLAGNSISKQLLTSGSMTGTATLLSSAFNIQDMSKVSLHLVWTGTPNGTFTVQVSNDPLANTPGTSPDWVDLTLASSVTASGSAANAGINLTDLGFAWMRVKYVNSSSTGTLQVYAHGKAL